MNAKAYFKWFRPSKLSLHSRIYTLSFSPKNTKVLDEMGQSIQEWTKYNLWRTPYNKLQVIWSASRF